MTRLDIFRYRASDDAAISCRLSTPMEQDIAGAHDLRDVKYAGGFSGQQPCGLWRRNSGQRPNRPACSPKPDGINLRLAPASWNNGEEKEGRHNHQVNNALEHRGTSGPERDDGNKQRQAEKHRLLRGEPQCERLAEKD
jgi:hypothetical protein